MPKLAPRLGVSDADLADTSREAIIQRPLPLGGPRVKSTTPDAADSRGIGLLFLLPFCSHNTPKQDETRARTTHQQKTWNCVLSNAFPARSEGYRAWPCCTHNPKVAGSNPAPATTQVANTKGAESLGPFGALRRTMKVFDRRALSFAKTASDSVDGRPGLL